MKVFVSVLVMVVALVSGAEAQTVINPTKVEVTASPDHNITALGAPLVDSYRLTYKDGATVVTVQNAGKPTATGGKFDVDIPVAVVAVKNKDLTVLVEILGPGGTAIEPVSAFFGYLGPPRASGTKPLPKP